MRGNFPIIDPSVRKKLFEAIKQCLINNFNLSEDEATRKANVHTENYIVRYLIEKEIGDRHFKLLKEAVAKKQSQEDVE